MRLNKRSKLKYYSCGIVVVQVYVRSSSLPDGTGQGVVVMLANTASQGLTTGAPLRRLL